MADENDDIRCMKCGRIDGPCSDQDCPEPSEEATRDPAADLLKAASEIRAEHHNGWGNVCEDAAHALTAMRAERDKWYQEAAAQAASAIAAHDELEALKAAPVVDVEAIKRDARAEALRNFRHEHGQDFSDAKKWREWQEAQRLIEEEMPEGYSVTLVCSPGNWDLRFTDPECEDIRIEDYESTEDFIRTAVAHAKEHVRAALASPEGSPR